MLLIKTGCAART